MSQERKPLVSHIFTADPSAHVFNGKIYIYPSHDIPHEGEDNDDGDEYRMEDYHILSMDGPEAECVDHGCALHMKDVPWVSKQMWAPDAAFKNGKYYLYFPARDKDGIFRLGVAVSDDPAGPFTPEENYIPGSYSIDPAVLVDDDGRSYIYYGGLWGGQLEMWQSGSFNPDEHRPDGPFTYKGRIMEPVLGWTTHHSIVEYNGKWYLFYHDCELSNGINHRRNVKFTELTIHEDGTIEKIFPYGE